MCMTCQPHEFIDLKPCCALPIGLSLILISLIYCCYCSVTKSCLTLCDPMDCSRPGFPVLQYLPEFAQIHVHWVDNATQPSLPLFPPSSPSLNLSQHQGLFQWVTFLHQVAKVLELQHQFFQWIFRVDFLLGLTGLISLQSKRLSRVFSSTTIQKHQFFGFQSSLWSKQMNTGYKASTT